MSSIKINALVPRPMCRLLQRLKRYLVFTEFQKRSAISNSGRYSIFKGKNGAHEIDIIGTPSSLDTDTLYRNGIINGFKQLNYTIINIKKCGTEANPFFRISFIPIIKGLDDDTNKTIHCL